MPLSETAVMLTTVAVTVATRILAIGVVVGVLVAMTLFARRVAHLTDTHRELVEGPDEVIIDLSDSHIWDASTVAALDAITHKYATKNKSVRIVGLNASSAGRHERLTGQLTGH